MYRNHMYNEYNEQEEWIRNHCVQTHSTLGHIYTLDTFTKMFNDLVKTTDHRMVYCFLEHFVAITFTTQNFIYLNKSIINITNCQCKGKIIVTICYIIMKKEYEKKNIALYEMSLSKDITPDPQHRHNYIIVIRY